MTDVIYYKIAEHEKEPDVNTDMPKEHVFLLASHRELRSYNFTMKWLRHILREKRKKCFWKWPMKSSNIRKKWNTYTPIQPFPRHPVDSSTPTGISSTAFSHITEDSLSFVLHPMVLVYIFQFFIPPQCIPCGGVTGLTNKRCVVMQQ